MEQKSLQLRKQPALMGNTYMPDGEQLFDDEHPFTTHAKFAGDNILEVALEEAEATLLLEEINELSEETSRQHREIEAIKLQSVALRSSTRSRMRELRAMMQKDV